MEGRLSNYNLKNFSRTRKIFFAVALFAISFTAFDYFSQFIDALADPSVTLSEGVMLSLRDITDQRTDVELDPIINSLQTELTITVTDPNANIHPLDADVVFASATSTTSGTDSATTTLTEISPGTFSGIITLSSSTTSGSNLETGDGDEIKVFYPIIAPPEPISQPNARVKATFGGVSGSGDVVLTPILLNATNSVPCPANPFLDAVDVSFTGTADATSIDITFSYANAELGGNDERFVEVIFSPIGNPFYSTLTPPQVPAHPQGFVNLIGHDFTAKTITNILQPSDVDGRYTLGIADTGCSGGGGGGLVRPGLVVNALAGISAAGGGSGGLPGPTITLGALALSNSGSEIISMPQEIRDAVNNHDPHTPLEPISDIYEDFDLPLSINGNGFALGGYENTLVSQTVEPGKPTEFTLVFYTTSEIAHTSLNFNLGPTRSIAGSDTQVLLYKDKFEIVDPNGNIATATGSINNEGDLKRVATFSITFSDSIEWLNSDLVIRSWNDNLNSGDIIVYDAIHVVPSVEEIAFEESLPEPEVEQLKSQYVPIWIKNNAAWWSQQLIEDSDFVAGIEYLIQQEIITLTDTGTLETNSSDEIPEWIKNNAGWWSEDLITEKEFIDGLQWLISNGIIQVTET